MKLKCSIAATVIFFLLLGLVYYIHITFFSVNVVFYASILDGFVAAILTGLALFLMGYFKSLGTFEKFQLIVIWLLLGYGFAISVPTVIDRSLSFYILEKIHQRGGGIKESAFHDVFTKEYVKEDQLVAVRLTEQLQSGTIIVQDGCVKLTPWGRYLVRFSTFFRHNLLPKKRLLMGNYTDALTHPFSDSETDVNYECQ